VTATAGILDLFAGTLTTGAGLLHGEKSLLHANLAMTATGAAVDWYGAFLRTAASASITAYRGWDPDLNRGASHRLFQIEFKVVTQVRTLSNMAATATAAAAEDIAKDIAKYVAKVGAASTGLPFQTGVTELIVASSFLGIRQNLEGFIGFLELVFRCLVVWITIRVMLHGNAPVSLLNIGSRSVPGNTQDFVVISL
jgi:hypothetical protein